MANKNEIQINLNRFENSRAVRLLLAIIVFGIISTPIRAYDGEDDALDRGAIAQANSEARDTELRQGSGPDPEQETNTFSVFIGQDDNVRNIVGDNVGDVDSTFPRGDAEVIGHITDGPLQATALGTWLVLEGGQHAIFSGVVIESSDDSLVTEEEASITQLYVYDTQAEQYSPEQVEPTPTPNIDPTLAAPEPPTPEQISLKEQMIAIYTPEIQDYINSDEISWDYEVGAPTREKIDANGDIIIEHFWPELGEFPDEDTVDGWTIMSTVLPLVDESTGQVTTLRFFNPENGYVRFEFNPEILDNPEALQFFTDKFLERYPQYIGKNINIIYAPDNYTDGGGGRIRTLLLNQMGFAPLRVVGGDNIMLRMSVYVEPNEEYPEIMATGFFLRLSGAENPADFNENNAWLESVIDPLYYDYDIFPLLLTTIPDQDN